MSEYVHPLYRAVHIEAPRLKITIRASGVMEHTAYTNILVACIIYAYLYGYVIH